jgi:hypothetical protein
MKFESGVIAYLLIIAVIPQCSRDIKCHDGTKTIASSSTSKPSAFIPPADSTISAQQLAAWFSCNPSLDSLSECFTKSLSAANLMTLTDSAQNIFLCEQDRICITKGLKGGHQEYRWVLEHLGSSKNKAVYDSIKSLLLPKK